MDQGTYTVEDGPDRPAGRRARPGASRKTKDNLEWLCSTRRPGRQARKRRETEQRQRHSPDAVELRPHGRRRERAKLPVCFCQLDIVNTRHERRARAETGPQSLDPPSSSSRVACGMPDSIVLRCRTSADQCGGPQWRCRCICSCRGLVRRAVLGEPVGDLLTDVRLGARLSADLKTWSGCSLLMSSWLELERSPTRTDVALARDFALNSSSREAMRRQIYLATTRKKVGQAASRCCITGTLRRQGCPSAH